MPSKYQQVIEIELGYLKAEETMQIGNKSGSRTVVYATANILTKLA